MSAVDPSDRQRARQGYCAWVAHFRNGPCAAIVRRFASGTVAERLTLLPDTTRDDGWKLVGRDTPSVHTSPRHVEYRCVAVEWRSGQLTGLYDLTEHTMPEPHQTKTSAPEPGTPRYERAARLLFSGDYDHWPAWKLRDLLDQCGDRQEAAMDQHELAAMTTSELCDQWREYSVNSASYGFIDAGHRALVDELVRRYQLLHEIFTPGAQQAAKAA